MDILNVNLQIKLFFEKFPTDVTRHCVDMRIVYCDHVVFQVSVMGKTPTTVLTNEFWSFKSSNNLLEQWVLPLVRVEIHQVTA